MKITLYIPCYNAEEYIDDILKAVFNQTLPADEVIVVDDGSTDNTAKIASGYPIRLIRHSENRGLSASRNSAIKNSKAEFIASLDADCLPSPGWLQHLMQGLDAPRVAGAGGKLLEKYSHDACGLWRSIHMKQYWEEGDSPQFLFGSNTIFRRKALLDVGLYNEKFKNNYEDVDISIRLKEKGYILIYTPEALAEHLRRDDIASILNAFWQWNVYYYDNKSCYSSLGNLTQKLKENILLANRYLEEDTSGGRDSLLYLDFLFSCHNSFRDLEYYMTKDIKNNQKPSERSLWFGLIDLTFSYHFNREENCLNTFLNKEEAPLQNFLAWNLMVASLINEKFKSRGFQKIFFRDSFLSLWRIEGLDLLLDRLLNLANLHHDWMGFCKKKHPYLNRICLDSLFFNFKNWLDQLEFRSPGVMQKIEFAAQEKNC